MSQRACFKHYLKYNLDNRPYSSFTYDTKQGIYANCVQNLGFNPQSGHFKLAKIPKGFKYSHWADWIWAYLGYICFLK